MPLPSGHRLGPYEIVAPLGAGGMGEVYRALDTRLRREVAIKVLPAEVGAHPERLRRFEQEARSAAALNHPGVLAVHDFGVEGGAPYLVTELLQGETLREALAGGPLPLARARVLARQLLDALAAAHDKGIVHRDLKPENVFLTRTGQAKILDFGLAKLVETPGSDLATAPTVAGVTQSGMVVGTVGYMAPEQVRGAAVDHRADLFAIGVVLYEALTGERPFAGASAVETLHAILRDEPPPPSRRLATLPALLDAVVARALAKEPAARFQSARDLAFALELAAGPGSGAGPAPIAAAVASDGAPNPARPGRGALVAALAAVAAGAIALAVWLGRPPAPTAAAAPAFATGTLTPLTTDPGYEAEASFLPDGETLVYVSDRSGDYEIYLQQVSGGAAINLTRDPGDDVQPAVSPDGRLVAFVSSRSSRNPIAFSTPRLGMTGGDIWVVPTLGGLARKVAENGNFPTWSPDGRTIYFLRGIWFSSEIRKVAATGGESEAVPVDLTENHGFLIWLRVSPDGRRLAFTASEAILTAPVEGGTATRVAYGRDPVWEPDGRALVFCNAEPGRNFGLWRQPLDERGLAAGAAEPLLTGPAVLASPALARAGRRLAVTAVERDSNLEVLPFDVEAGRVLGEPRVLQRGRNQVSFATASPDGRSIVYEDARGAAGHLWRIDPGGERVQVTADPALAEAFPRWSPDGERIAFARRPAGEARATSNAQLWTMRPDGGDPRKITDEGGNMAWLPDSRRLVVFHRSAYRIVDAETGAATPLLLDGPKPTSIFVVSPDGRWLVYNTPEGEDGDLALAPIAGGKVRVFRFAGYDGHPSFDRAGRWLYFQSPTHRNLWRIPGPAQGWREAAPERTTHFPESGLFLEDPTLVADGRSLVYSRVRTAADLWIVDAEARPITPAGETTETP